MSFFTVSARSFTPDGFGVECKGVIEAATSFQAHAIFLQTVWPWTYDPVHVTITEHKP